MAGLRLLEVPSEAEGIFWERPNRFLAWVECQGRRQKAHIHDPGRLPDLVRPGRRVLLKKGRNPKRKTAWDILAFRHQDYWCFCHSGYHRALVQAFLWQGRPLGEPQELRPEPRIGEGRLDFYLKGPDGEWFIETKGVTWARGDVALFPDAPTQRGLRHLQSLRELLKTGYRAALWFLVFRKEAREVRPAVEIQPAFAKLLKESQKEGLLLQAFLFSYNGRFLSFERELPVRL